MCLMMDFAITGNARKDSEGMDREKVIKGLECCLDIGTDHCDECPYSNDCFCNPKDIEEGLLADAIALLKEQEAKTGTWQWKIHGKAASGGTLGEAICDQCGKSTYATAVKGDLNYCPNCGAKMEQDR